MKLNVPKDIKRYILKKRLMRIIPFICLTAALVSILVFVPFSGDNPGLSKTITAILGIPLIVLLTGVPFKLIDSSWRGEVTEIRQKTFRKSASPGKPSFGSTRASRSELYNNWILTLKSDNGRIIRRNGGPSPVYRPDSFEDDYHIGDKVVHIAGTDYTVVLNHPDTVRCCICGISSDKKNDSCPGCGHTLIKENNYK